MGQNITSKDSLLSFNVFIIKDAPKRAEALGYTYPDYMLPGNEKKNLARSLKYSIGRKYIEKATFFLALKKRINDITTKDLAEESGINRATIYRDYEDAACRKDGVFTSETSTWRFDKTEQKEDDYIGNIFAYSHQRLLMNFIILNDISLETLEDMFNLIDIIAKIHADADFTKAKPREKAICEVIMKDFIQCVLFLSGQDRNSYFSNAMRRAKIKSGIYELHYEIMLTTLMKWFFDGRTFDIPSYGIRAFDDIDEMVSVRREYRSRETGIRLEV